MERKNGITEIYEPDVYTDTNTAAYGSYLIIASDSEKISDIVEEAYEEISERI